MENTKIEHYQSQRLSAIQETISGAPHKTTNAFFGVGPITDMASDEMDARMMQKQFEQWIEKNYIKYDDRGNPVGNFSVGELKRSMHRGYPADKVLCDMMREIHTYFEFPKKNPMAVGLGGGHSGFSVAAMHLMRAGDSEQKVYVDTPKPESELGKAGGFFRQSWGVQLMEMQKYAKNGNPDLIFFSDEEGAIPSTERLLNLGIKLFFGVGHETTGATTYTEQEIRHLLAWIDHNPDEHHAVIDVTSLLGAMVWEESLVKKMLSDCCMFMPFQKAIGGVSGYFIVSLTPQALKVINENQKNKSWAIPRQLKLTVPTDAKRPLSSENTTALGPIYDPQKETMLGGIINTYSILAFAETTFAILYNKEKIGSVNVLNRRSQNNKMLVEKWLANHSIFVHGVSAPESRGAAVTLLKVNDPDITQVDIHNRIIAKSKQLLGYEGITHPNGDYERGLGVARYVNAFPGTPGDYRAWVGGIRPEADVINLLENLRFAYYRAKIVVLEEELVKSNIHFESNKPLSELQRKDEANRAYKVLIADLVGIAFDAQGAPDYGDVQKYIEGKGGFFHVKDQDAVSSLPAGVHFFYQPDLSLEDDILSKTAEGQYDAVIAAATFIPAKAKFACGGVRIGAGTGNMASESWGGGNGSGGTAPLMNTPSFNSRATAQAAMKALLKVKPDLKVNEMYDRVLKGNFDTGKHLKEYPCRKLEGQTIAVIGYGNIGREVAKLAKAFGLHVVVYARPVYKDWIESEGFIYADSIAKAAKGADILSPHLGLGARDANTKAFANEGIINTTVLEALNPGAVLINYDRGELIDIVALEKALDCGQVSYVAIDADVFVDAEGQASGPMLPYLNMVKKYPEKMELLPHAAADTEHVSRVEGAKQAVDQILAAIQFKCAVNLKGDLPEGYTNGGIKTIHGIGKVQIQHYVDLKTENIRALKEQADYMSSFWGAIDTTHDAVDREALINRYAQSMTLMMNRYKSQLDELGLFGPLMK